MRIAYLIFAMVALFSCKEEDEEPVATLFPTCHNTLPANTYVTSDDTLSITAVTCSSDLILSSTGGIDINITLGSDATSDLDYRLVPNEPGADEAVIAAVYGATVHYSKEGQLRLRILDDGTKRLTWCDIEAVNNLNVSQASFSRIISGRIDCD